MKKVIIIFLAFIGGLWSCYRESVVTITYYYENKSGVDIKILDLDREQEIVSVANSAVYEVKASGRHEPYPFRKTGTIEVVFNGDRSIKYTRTPPESKVENNPLSLQSYRVVTIKEKKYESEYAYYYTFTEKQYQDAEPYVQGK